MHVCGGGGALGFRAEPHISYSAFEVLKSNIQLVGRVWSGETPICVGAGAYPPT